MHKTTERFWRNFNNLPDGIRYAVSFDDEKPQIINMTSNPNPPDLNHDGVWNKWVSENINIQTSTHTIMKPGKHILKFWMVDPAVVLEKIVIKTHNIPSSYLGPPERPVKKFTGSNIQATIVQITKIRFINGKPDLYLI